MGVESQGLGCAKTLGDPVLSAMMPAVRFTGGGILSKSEIHVSDKTPAESFAGSELTTSWAVLSS